MLRPQPHCRAPGATCGARAWGAPHNSLRALRAAFEQMRRARRRSLRVLRHAGHPSRCAPRRILKGVGAGHRCARPNGGTTAVGLFFGRAVAPPGSRRHCAAAADPLAPRLRRGAQGVGRRVCRRTHPPRAHACCGCPSGALQARSEFRSTPRDRAPQGARSEAQGRRRGVAFSLVTFFWRSKRKSLRRRAHIPAPDHSTSKRQTTATNNQML